MPSKSWGNSVGSGSGATLTAAFDYVANDGNGAGLHNPRVTLSSKSGWSDSTNWIEVLGSAVGDARIHTSSGSNRLDGGTRTWSVNPEWQLMQYGSTTWVRFTIRVYGISFFNGDQATTDYHWDIELPAKPYQPPRSANNFSNTYINDSRCDLLWGLNFDGGNGPQPWHNQVIRRTNTGDWANEVDAVWLTWSVDRWTDNSLQPNNRYDYRHFAVNPAGWSPAAYAPNAIYTTPAAPTQLVATKQANGSIKVEAVNNAPWAYRWVTRRSADGVNWQEFGEWTTPTFVLESPSTAQTHRFQMLAVTPDGKRSAWSNVSNIVQLLAPPNAPTWNAVDPAYDATAAITTTWNHNPVDTTPQSAYEIEWQRSLDNGATWNAMTSTGKITATSSSRVWAASTFPQNAMIQMRVRTWGAYAGTAPTYSAWSALMLFRTSARPTAGITSPTPNEVIPGKSIQVAWNYADTEGTAQSSYEVSLFKGSELLGRWSAFGSASSFDVPYALEDDTAYRVEVRVRDGSSLWSLPSATPFSVDYKPPMIPIVNFDWIEEIGAVVLNISNPVPTDGKPVAVSNDIYRDGQLIATNVGINTAFVDPLTLPSGSTYWVDAISALPSAARVEATPEVPLEVSRRFWLNTGAGWGIVASFYGNVSRSYKVSSEREVEHYAGRALPVETIGESQDEELSFSTVLVQQYEHPDLFHAIVRAKSPICFRGENKRFFVSLSSTDESTTQNITAGMSFSMKRVDYKEEIR